MPKQCTVSDVYTTEGIGVHSGNVIRISVKPAPVNTGIVFIRDDIGEKISVSAKYTVGSPMCTMLRNENGAEIKTVEHLLASLYALGITNAFIHVTNDEIPIFDGSALNILDFIKGTKAQPEDRKKIVISEEISVSDGEKRVKLVPCAEGLVIDVTCDFEQKGLGTTNYVYKHSLDAFKKEIAFSRTFGFYEDAAAIKKLGLARGASLDNTVIFKDGKCINNGGLRSPTEYVTHKILDVIGDLSVSGYDIYGKFYGICPGHTINGMLIKKLLGIL